MQKKMEFGRERAVSIVNRAVRSAHASSDSFPGPQACIIFLENMGNHLLFGK